MRAVWEMIGRLGFFLCQPALKIYLNNSLRTRTIIVSGEYTLLVKHWLGEGSWMLAGGGRKSTEDPLAAIQRETSEELGLNLPAKSFKHLGTKQHSSKGFSFSYDLYRVDLKDRQNFKTQKFEIFEARWFHYDELSTLKLTSEVAESLRSWHP